MFGFVICNRNNLKQEEYDIYRSVYCGLCYALKNRYGNLYRCALNYDMVFLAMMLNSLYDELVEDEVVDRITRKDVRCILHPTKKRRIINNEFIDYAADMTILLTYYKCIDDIEDEDKKSAKVYKLLLNKAYRRVASRYKRQTSCVKDALEKFNDLEKKGKLTADVATNLSGIMLSEIFVYKEDYFAENLRNFAYELGRFIYLIDGTLDYEKDIKDNCYNPLIELDKKPEDMEDVLERAIGNATFYFEKLPIVKDENILKNILYSGVWQKYYHYLSKKK